jgi:hypothetical protein
MFFLIVLILLARSEPQNESACFMLTFPNENDGNFIPHILSINSTGSMLVHSDFGHYGQIILRNKSDSIFCSTVGEITVNLSGDNICFSTDNGERICGFNTQLAQYHNHNCPLHNNLETKRLLGKIQKYKTRLLKQQQMFDTLSLNNTTIVTIVFLLIVFMFFKQK